MVEFAKSLKLEENKLFVIFDFLADRRFLVSYHLTADAFSRTGKI